MPTTLLATQVPLPTTYSGFLRVLDGENTTGNAPVARKFTTSGTSAVSSSKLNANFTMMDLEARYGGGGLYHVCHGLTLSAGAGLTLNVAQGHAVISGLVELATNSTIVVPDATARVHIWLKQDGTLTYVANSITPPAGEVCYIGSCVTAGGVITSVDDSGIVKAQGGSLVRTTADTAAPTDTPSATIRFFAKTSGGTYWWNGTAYVELPAADALNNLTMKKAVRVATTANGTLATAYENGDTVDGVVLATGDRILLKDQTTGAENGIYTVNASGAPTRATDADLSAKVTAGLMVYVAEGTANADTLWALTTNTAITLGTTALVFGKLANAGPVAANKAWIGPTSGADAQPTFRVLDRLDLPLVGVEAQTGNDTLVTADKHKVMTNEGAISKPTLTLQTAAAGESQLFVVQDTDGLRVTAAAGDTIRLGPTVSKAAGYVESTEVGAALWIVAINATEWVALSVIGAWTVETS